MQNDTTDRADMSRMADDGCPNADTKVHDLSALLAALGKDDATGG